MTYKLGGAIQASDLNGFLTTVGNVYGVGNADRGYGQSAITQAPVTAGGIIHASQWTNLYDLLVVCAHQQGTNVTTLPPSNVYTTGDPIDAYEQAAPTDSPYELANNITAIDTNRLNASTTSMSIATAVWSVSYSPSWTGSITAVVSVTWASENAARYFFNSAGQIRIYGTAPTFGMLDFEAHTTTGGNPLGFYGLTNSYQTIYSGTSVGFYTDNVTVAAERLNYVGVNGGNGSGVQFQITLTGANNTTNVSFDVVRATTFLTGITPPTFATVTPF